MTKPSKNAPVVDVLHAVELEGREHLLGVRRNLQPATKKGQIRPPFHCNPSDKYKKINTRRVNKNSKPRLKRKSGAIAKVDKKLYYNL